MFNKQLPIVFIAGSLLLFLGACSSKEEMPTEEEVVEKIEPVVQPVVEEAPAPAPRPAPAAPTLDETLLQVRTFYFDYDQADLRDIAINALDVHAENILNRLATNPDIRVQIEGHADERGTIAYNNALGNRRAEAVARYLRVRGVPAAIISIVSYGELRPVSEDSTESAWQLNRRSVLNY